MLYLKGRLGQATEATAKAAEHARLANTKREEAMAIGQYGFCLFGGPTSVDEAIANLIEILENARGNQIIAASVHGFLALQESLAGQIDQARKRIAESLCHTRDLGLTWLTAIHYLLSAYMDSLAGDPGGAERHLLTAKQAFVEIGDHLFLSTVLVDLVRAVHDQGRYEDALALTVDMDRWPAHADTEWQIKRRVVRALLLARTGEGSEACDLAAQAVRLAGESEFTLLHGDGLLALSDVHALGGRHKDAIAAAREAAAVHLAKGNAVGAAAARKRLEALAS